MSFPLLKRFFLFFSLIFLLSLYFIFCFFVWRFGFIYLFFSSEQQLQDEAIAGDILRHSKSVVGHRQRRVWLNTALLLRRREMGWNGGRLRATADLSQNCEKTAGETEKKSENETAVSDENAETSPTNMSLEEVPTRHLFYDCAGRVRMDRGKLQDSEKVHLAQRFLPNTVSVWKRQTSPYKGKKETKERQHVVYIFFLLTVTFISFLD